MIADSHNSPTRKRGRLTLMTYRASNNQNGYQQFNPERRNKLYPASLTRRAIMMPPPQSNGRGVVNFGRLVRGKGSR